MWERSKSIKKEYTNQDKKLVAAAKKPFKDADATSAMYTCMYVNEIVPKNHIYKNSNLPTHRKETIQLKTQ